MLQKTTVHSHGGEAMRASYLEPIVKWFLGLLFGLYFIAWLVGELKDYHDVKSGMNIIVSGSELGQESGKEKVASEVDVNRQLHAVEEIQKMDKKHENRPDFYAAPRVLIESGENQKAVEYFRLAAEDEQLSDFEINQVLLAIILAVDAEEREERDGQEYSQINYQRVAWFILENGCQEAFWKLKESFPSNVSLQLIAEGLNKLGSSP